MPPPTAAARRRWYAVALSLAALVFATRWPFLDAGFGRDFDAWLLANAAKWIHMSGNYHASRRPGYPVSEVLFALVHDFGFRGLNGLSAAACAVSAALLASLVRAAGHLRAWLTGALSAAVPLVFVASTSTMDYLPSVAFLLLGLLLVQSGRARTAGVALALAIGARAANAPLALALAVALWMQRGRAQAVRLALWTLGLAVLCYVPVVLSADAGLGYFVPALRGRPPLALVVESASVETWGQLGLAAIVVGALLALPAIARRWRAPSAGERPLLAALALVILLTALQFAVLPLEAGYLIPGVVATCGLVGWHLRPRLLAPLVALVAAGGFVDLGGAGGGVIGRDQAQRARDVAELADVLQAVRALEEPTVVLTGPAHARVLYYVGFMQNDPRSRVRFVQAIGTEQRAREVLDGGEALRYLNGVADWMRNARGVDVEALGARPLLGER
jgi:hypothetical protein